MQAWRPAGRVAELGSFARIVVKTAIKIASLVGVLLVLALGAIFVLLGGPQSLSLRRHFDRLVKTNDHGAVARTAIAVIEATTNQTLFMNDRLTNLPPLIAGMKPRYVSVSPDQMTIEFHGGFDHFGFRIDDRVTSWEMYWYTEDGRHPLLTVGKGEQNGPANGSQSVRSETNKTSSASAPDGLRRDESAAGSRR